MKYIKPKSITENPKTAFELSDVVFDPALLPANAFADKKKTTKSQRGFRAQKRGNLPPNRYIGQKMPQIEIFPRNTGNFENRGNLPPKPGFGASKPL